MQIFIGIHTPVHFISLYSFQLDLTLTSWWLAGELRTQKINVWKSLENQVKKGIFFKCEGWTNAGIAHPRRWCCVYLRVADAKSMRLDVMRFPKREIKNDWTRFSWLFDFPSLAMSFHLFPFASQSNIPPPSRTLLINSIIVWVLSLTLYVFFFIFYVLTDNRETAAGKKDFESSFVVRACSSSSSHRIVVFIGNCADFVWDFHCFRCDDISYHWENKPQLSNCTAAAQRREFSHCSEMSILLNEPNRLMLIKNQKLHPSEVSSFLRKLFILKIIFNFSIRGNSSELAAAALLVFRGNLRNLCVFRSRYESSLTDKSCENSESHRKITKISASHLTKHLLSLPQLSYCTLCVHKMENVRIVFPLFSPFNLAGALFVWVGSRFVSENVWWRKKMEDNIFPPLSNS